MPGQKSKDNHDMLAKRKSTKMCRKMTMWSTKEKRTSITKKRKSTT